MELTEENYYDVETDKVFMSTSQYKEFIRCEASAMARLRGEWEYPKTPALLIGSYIDRAIEGTLKQFMEENKEYLFNKNGSLKADFVKADKIIEKMQNDPLFMQYCSGDKQTIVQFDLGDVPWKAKLDVFHKDLAIVDVKCMRNFANLVAFRYDLQATVYQHGIEQVYGTKLPFYLACVTKEEEPDIDIFQIDQDSMDLAMAEILDNLPHIMDVKEGRVEPVRCGKCPYCLKTKKASVRSWLELMND